MESRVFNICLQCKHTKELKREIMDKLEKSLSMEQEFNHRVFAERVKQLSREEAIGLLVQMHKQSLYKDNIYKELLLNQEKDIVDALFGVSSK